MVERYKPTVTQVTGECYGAAHPDGDFVKFSDYDALAARLAEIERQSVSDHNRWATERLNREARLAEAEATSLARYESLYATDKRLAAAEALLRDCKERIRSQPPEHSEGEREMYRVLGRIGAFLTPATINPDSIGPLTRIAADVAAADQPSVCKFCNGTLEEVRGDVMAPCRCLATPDKSSD